MEKNQIISLALIFFLSLSMRAFILLCLNELILDEPTYAQTIDEFIQSPTLVPRYLGEPVGWKPPLMFYIYAPFAKLFLSTGFPLEIAYRLPSFFFSIASVGAVYLVMREFMEKDDALATAAVYSSFAINAITGSLLLTDNLFVLLMLGGILFYARGIRQERNFLIAGAFTLLAFWVKLHLAAMIPLVGAFYCLRKSPAIWKNKHFLASFLGIPIAFALLITVYASEGGLASFWFSYQYELSGRISSLQDIFFSMAFNLRNLVYLFPWIGFSILGAAKINWKDPAWQAIALWALLLFVSFSSKEAFYWYLLPVLPALSAFAMKALDSFRGHFAFTLFLVPIILIVFISALAISLPQADQKEAGLYLSGKGDVLFIVPELMFRSWPDYYGFYPDSPVPLVISNSATLFYKLHNEPKSKIQAAYLPFLNESADVSGLISEFIGNSSAQTVLIQTKYACKNTVDRAEDPCVYNFTVPGGFKETGISNGWYLILERKK